MKQAPFVLALSIGAIAVGTHAAHGQVPNDTLRDLLSSAVSNESLVGKLVYVSREPLPGGKSVRSWRTEFQVPRQFSHAWFYFIDDAPKANWEHPCRYVFVETKTRAHVIMKAMTPPKDLAAMVVLDVAGGKP